MDRPLPHNKNFSEIAVILETMYRTLLGHFDHRGWWPADSPFEVCVGAVLTQNTSWRNVAKAIANLKAADALSPETIHRLSQEDLAELIRPSGYFNVKARRLKNFVDVLVNRHHGSLDRLFDRSKEELRAELLAINGIGKETADSVILYAADMPVFVVDAYTRRVLTRHGLAEESVSYDEMQSLFEAHVQPDVELYKDFHAQIVAVGAHYCKRRPLCDTCPLKNL